MKADYPIFSEVNAVPQTHRWMVFFIVFSIILLDSFAGPIRFALGELGGDAIVYIPKVLVFMQIWYVIFFLKVKWPQLVLLICTVFGLLVSTFQDYSIYSTAFGLFLLAPFYAAAFSVEINFYDDRFKRSVFLFWFLSCLGVFVNYFVTFPWEGNEASLLGVAVENNRSWETFGVVRLSGFTRMSTIAAINIGAACLYLCIAVNNKIYKFLFAAISLAAIYFTTTKTVAGSLLVCFLFLFSNKYFLRFSRFAIFSTLIFSFFVPIFFAIFDIGGLDLGGEDERILLSSLEERLVSTWPNFYAGIDSKIFGEGIGGVGSALKFSLEIHKSAYMLYSDSMALYLIGIFGIVVALLFFSYLALFVDTGIASKGGNHYMLAMLVVYCISVGFAIDVFEAVLPMVVIGFAICSDYKSFAKAFK